MGKKQAYAAPACALLIVALAFASCPNTVDYSDVERGTFYYLKIQPEPENGTLILSHDRAAAGTQVRVYILPDPGFVPDLAELRFRTFDTVRTSSEPIPKQSWFYYAGWNMRPFDSTVTAKFVPKRGTNTYTVSVERNLQNGFIVPDIRNNSRDNVDEGRVGDVVTLHIFPSDGFILAPGSITIKDVSGNPVEGLNLTSELPYKFSLPASDIIVRADFMPADYQGIFNNAVSHLRAGKYDLAARFYKDAYDRRSEATDANQRNEVIFYHSLGKLASILIDPDVRTFLGSGAGNLHMAIVPTTLEDWFCDSDSGWTGHVDNESHSDDRWYKKWPGIDYENAGRFQKGYDIDGDPVLWKPSTEITDDIILPKLQYYFSIDRQLPGSFANSFGDYRIAQAVDTRLKFSNMFFWVMLSQWRNLGFNTMFERIEENLLGRDFEAAAAIAQTLPADAKVPLYPNLKNRFKSPLRHDYFYDVDPDDPDKQRPGLERLYGEGTTYVGKAELDYIFGVLRLVKASLRYLRSYDWTTDIRPLLIDDFGQGLGLDQIIHTMLYMPENFVNYEVYWNNTFSISRILPLKNRFLEIGNAGFVASSKNEFTKALNMISSSMNYWFSASGSKPAGSNLSQEGHDNYRWKRSMFNAARNALDNNGIFYFNSKLPDPGETWPTQSRDAEYGVSLGVFFTPGVFNLKNLLSLEPGVFPAPMLYKIPWFPDTNSGEAVLQPFSAVRVSAPIPDDDGETVNGIDVPYMVYSFEVNTGNLRRIFPKGFEQTLYSPTAGSGHPSGPSGERAFLYQVFPTIPLWPERPTYFSGPGNSSEGSRNRSAQLLYDYYRNGFWFRKQ